MVAPIGRRKRVMRLSTLLFSSTQRIVMGNVIELSQTQALVTLSIYHLKLDLEFVVTSTLCPSPATPSSCGKLCDKMRR